VIPSFDGLPIAYEIHGSGATALVFVHGWSCDRGYWRAQVDAFADGYGVVLVDLGGHGESGNARAAWTIASFGEDVAAVVREAGLGSVLLIGHSMGGDVIVEAARLLPGRVLGLVWVDVYASLGTGRTPEQVRERMEPFRASFAEATRAFVRRMFPAEADPALVGRISEGMAQAPPAIALPALEAAWTNRSAIPGGLRELALPVCAINPDDGTTDLENMRAHGVTVDLMPRVGHFPMLEDPARFNRLLREVVLRIAP
jgi:pimeloyl-ACP methyl ester carboxylesterase